MKDVEELIQKTVMNYVSTNEVATEDLSHMSEFVVLQRLFRTAFAGSLGNQFPIEQFVRLARDTVIFVNRNSVRTPRWNVGGCMTPDEFKELFKTFREIDSQQFCNLYAATTPCLNILPVNMDTKEISAKFKKECDNKSRTTGFQLTVEDTNTSENNVNELPAQLQIVVERISLMRTLGVDIDNCQLEGDTVCPKP